MRPEERDSALLWDMREAASEVVNFVQGVTYQQFVDNRILRFAVERQLLVIGEAASHISDAFREKHPEIPWMGIIGQRNVLAHEYGDILVDRVWLVAKERLPDLIRLLDPLIPLPPDSKK